MLSFWLPDRTVGKIWEFVKGEALEFANKPKLPNIIAQLAPQRMESEPANLRCR